jgi:hypothetical protein
MIIRTAALIAALTPALLAGCSGPMDQGPLAVQAGGYSPTVVLGRPGETYTTPLVPAGQTNLDRTPPIYRGTYCWNRGENRYYHTTQNACVEGDPVITEDQFNAFRAASPRIDDASGSSTETGSATGGRAEDVAPLLNGAEIGPAGTLGDGLTGTGAGVGADAAGVETGAGAGAAGDGAAGVGDADGAD